MNERQRLRDLLLAKSYRQGTFTLTSGKTSDFYVDGKQTTLDAEGAYLCGRQLFELIRSHPEPIVGVGGMTLGADPLVTAVSLVSYLEKAPIPAFIVRKEAKGHGTGNFIEGKSNLPAGGLMALVEDVVTTSSTSAISPPGARLLLPSMKLPVPWPLASLRTMKAGIGAFSR